MLFEHLPKITRIEGGTGTVESEEFLLDNYKVAAFLFDNAEGGTVTVKVKANTEDGAAEYVPFFLKTADTNGYEPVDADGKEITDAGAFVAVVTADMLSHNEYDRVSVELGLEGDTAALYALQAQPRYNGDE